MKWHGRYIRMWEPVPFCQSVKESCVVCPQDEDNIKPPLGEEVATVIVNYSASLSHFILH